MNKIKARLDNDKTVSIILITFGSIGIVFWLFSGVDALFVGVCILVGILMICRGCQISMLIGEFKRYVSVISKVSNDIPDIATTLKLPENVVRNKLELMINKGYFGIAHIDYNLNSIIIENMQIVIDAVPLQTIQANTRTKQMITVTCNGCGAVNTIKKGTVSECEYCGAPIEGK